MKTQMKYCLNINNNDISMSHYDYINAFLVLNQASRKSNFMFHEKSIYIKRKSLIDFMERMSFVYY